MESQKQEILHHLLSGKPITPIQALRDYGCFRLGARIYDLRDDGYMIERELTVDPDSGKRFATYWMSQEERARHG